MPSMSWAWISTPAIRSATGVAWYRPRASAVTPTSTSFLSNCRTSAAPDSTAAADTKRDGIVARVVDPDAAVRLGGNDEVADDHRLDAARAGAHRHGGLPRGHAQHLEAEAGHEQACDVGDSGHAPDHPALGVGR